MSTIEGSLTEGLIAGYAGGEVTPVERGGFHGKSTRSKNEPGYRDEWFTGVTLGGGQELVEAGGQQFTRLYAGGTLGEMQLKSLGTSGEEVIGYLKKKIIKLGDRTRLFEDCDPPSDGDWKYTYKVKEKSGEISVATGREVIQFQERRVFIHDFILCPIQ